MAEVIPFTGEYVWALEDGRDSKSALIYPVIWALLAQAIVTFQEQIGKVLDSDDTQEETVCIQWVSLWLEKYNGLVANYLDKELFSKLLENMEIIAACTKKIVVEKEIKDGVKISDDEFIDELIGNILEHGGNIEEKLFDAYYQNELNKKIIPISRYR